MKSEKGICSLLFLCGHALVGAELHGTGPRIGDHELKNKEMESSLKTNFFSNTRILTVTNALCSAHPDCVALAGPDCCPTQDGVFLDCCDFSITPNGQASPPPAPPLTPTPPSTPPVTASPIPRTTPPLAPPSRAPPTPPSPPLPTPSPVTPPPTPKSMLPTTSLQTDNGNEKDRALCSAHPRCAALAGGVKYLVPGSMCCPAPHSGGNLSCCDTSDRADTPLPMMTPSTPPNTASPVPSTTPPLAPPSTPPTTSLPTDNGNETDRALCSAHPRCAALAGGIENLVPGSMCCPTLHGGGNLSCCDTSDKTDAPLPTMTPSTPPNTASPVPSTTPPLAPPSTPPPMLPSTPLPIPTPPITASPVPSTTPPLAPPSTPPTTSLPTDNGNETDRALCSAHPRCAALAGGEENLIPGSMCCPTLHGGGNLSCCDTSDRADTPLPMMTPSTPPITASPVPSTTPPVAPPSTPPTTSLPTDNSNETDRALCSAHPRCAALAGGVEYLVPGSMCCPTLHGGGNLSCCDTSDKTDAPLPTMTPSTPPNTASPVPSTTPPLAPPSTPPPMLPSTPLPIPTPPITASPVPSTTPPLAPPSTPPTTSLPTDNGNETDRALCSAHPRCAALAGGVENLIPGSMCCPTLHGGGNLSCCDE